MKILHNLQYLMVRECPGRPPNKTIFFSTSTRFLTFNPIFWCNRFFAFLVHFWGLWPSGPSRSDPPRNFMQNGLVEKFRALTATRFVPFFAFNFDRQFLANIFVLLTPINQGYPPTHGQHSTLLWLKNPSLWWSTTSWLCGISHTNRPPGVGDHFCCP